MHDSLVKVKTFVPVTWALIGAGFFYLVIILLLLFVNCDLSCYKVFKGKKAVVIIFNL